ncbi:MAG: HlyD family efflux transporter periplasmic adaptor subunit [Firmicutes bacterium]|nr:HlyD family efflux transporter periplasmic adaptor subunit [Bacillota bacterium]
MEEKKRGWVKNVAIVFLTIMLLLTFFSNTIMNRSLPQVAVQYAQSGTIETQIRGSGTVKANESYEVSIDQTREIKTVAVRSGDEVRTGDVLFILADMESAELEAAKETLESLQMQYDKKMLYASVDEYTSENRQIAKVQEALMEAEADIGKYYVTDDDIEAAERKVKRAQDEVDDLSSGDVEMGDIDAQEEAVQAAYDALQVVEMIYGADYNALKVMAEERMAADGASSSKLHVYMAALAETDGSAYAVAYREITAAQELYEDEEAKLDRMEDSDALAEAREELAEREEKLAQLKADQAKYEAALEERESLLEQLEDLTNALADKQLADSISKAEEELDLKKLRSDIAKQREKVKELQSDAVDAVITAPVSGIVTSVNISAGNTTGYNQTLATIEVPDMGYAVEFSVTNEQARNLRVGADAEVTNYWWGDEIKAKLVSIKTEPGSNGQSKMLRFALEGDNIDVGSTYNISVGQRSSNYDVVIPSSAIRQDSNGSFVLMVTSKNTPLGNRYTAKRVDVNVLASDDKNSAVSGGLSNWDYVITSSNAPVEPGSKVRLAEN